MENSAPPLPVKVKKPVSPKAAPPIVEVSPTAKPVLAPRRSRTVKPAPLPEPAPPAVAAKEATAKKRAPKEASMVAEVKKASTAKGAARSGEAPPPAVPPEPKPRGKKRLPEATPILEVAPVQPVKATKSAAPKEEPKIVKELIRVPTAKAAPKPRSAAKKATPRRKADTRITVYIARGGPARGEADYEQAFPNRPQALAFLSNQHGLSTEEQRQLAKASRLKLNRRWHGSEACALREIALHPDQAARMLRGEAVAV